MKEEVIKSELIELLDINDKELIKYIDIFLDDAFVKNDLDLVIAITRFKIKELLNTHKFREDENKLFTTLGIIYTTMKDIKSIPPF